MALCCPSCHLITIKRNGHIHKGKKSPMPQLLPSIRHGSSE